MEPAPSSPASVSSKLRLLCSYGGRIIPRPHDKTLCYAGGESRLLAVDRRSATVSLTALTSHISRTLLNNRPFTLKYQLPDHDLDSLVSVATDEDLVNMIDEYDRAAISANPTRLRFFLFPPAAKVETLSSAAPEYDPKSEAWFFDALKSAGIAVNDKRSSESESGGEGVVDSDGKASDSSAAMNSEVVSSTRSAPPSLPAIKVSGGGGGGGGEDKTGGLAQDFSAAYSLVDSPESDSSATSPNFQSPTLVYLDSLSPHSDPIDSKLFTTPTPIDPPDLAPTDHLSPVQTYSYSFSQPMDQLHSYQQQQQQLQPQYIHAHPQYVPQYYSTTPPYSAQYQPYLQQQQPQQPAYQMNKPYPVYLMHVGAQDLTPTQLMSKPIRVTAKSPEIAAKMYRTGPTVPAAAAVDAAGFEFDEPMLHSQIYKTQVPRQAAANAATAMLFDNLTKLQLDTTK